MSRPHFVFIIFSFFHVFTIVSGETKPECREICEKKCTLGGMPEYPATGTCSESNIHCDCGSKVALIILIVITLVLVIGRIIASCFCYSNTTRLSIPDCVCGLDVIGSRGLARALALEGEACILSTRTTAPSISNSASRNIAQSQTVPMIDQHCTIATEGRFSDSDPPPSYAQATEK